MKLESITPEHVREALGLYVALAWPSDREGQPRMSPEDLPEAKTLEDLLPFFECPRSEEKVAGRRYTLRLGNFRYPFMKFVFQEYLLEGEFFFSVDTHDELSITPDMPDYQEWQGVRALNAELKREIESSWATHGLPTHEALRELMEHAAQSQVVDCAPVEGKRARLLIADDEQDVACGLGAMLDAKGYDVCLAFDGQQAIEALELDPLPNLVVLDFSMPGLTGEQVIERLRADPRTCQLPVVLATATDIAPEIMAGANALLRKPYPQQLLFRVIEDQLEPWRAQEAIRVASRLKNRGSESQLDPGEVAEPE
ncbi:MAG: CheY-like chemotaxis protein [Planctomycetota bacterium]|jgi:CheY-like chemotaxis protein